MQSFSFSNQTAPLESLSIAAEKGKWKARLDLGFRQLASGCRLYRQSHVGPLYVQKPFYPEGADLAHVYLLHPPGGLVSGDELTISLDLEEDSKVLVTTPGAGRIYMARSDLTLQKQSNILRLEKGATLEWFPQETIVYTGANAALETNVFLSQNSTFCGWDITSLGLPASKIAFEEGRFSQQLRIFMNGRPRFVESFLVDNVAALNAISGLRGMPINGLMVAGPIKLDKNQMEALREEVCGLQQDNHFGLTLVNNFLVARYLGSCSEQARNRFILLWQHLRPLLLDRMMCKPRIWST